MGRTKTLDAPLNKAAKDLLFRILELPQIKEMLGFHEITVAGYSFSNETGYKIQALIMDALRSEKENEGLMKEIGTLKAEREILINDITELKRRLGLSPSYSVEKLKDNFTIKELYMKKEVSAALYRSLDRADIRTLHDLKRWSTSELLKIRGFGQTRLHEADTLKQKHGIA